MQLCYGVRKWWILAEIDLVITCDNESQGEGAVTSDESGGVVTLVKAVAYCGEKSKIDQSTGPFQRAWERFRWFG